MFSANITFADSSRVYVRWIRFWRTFAVNAVGSRVLNIRDALLVALFLSPFSGTVGAQTYTPFTFSTLAGSPNNGGTVDGTGSAAKFYAPAGLAVDQSGNLYVADQNDSTIRKVSPSGVVTTLAGIANKPGNADGVGTSAQFSSPQGVAVDSGGNVYVADTGNSLIRKITAAGVVTTVAGQSAVNVGSANGPGPDTRFSGPQGISVDSSGNVYVADTGNNLVRKITFTPNAQVTAIAGSLNAPVALTVDQSGNVYAYDQNDGTISLITPNGAVTTFAGTAGKYGYADGVGAAARFYNIHGLAVDGAGNVFAADTNNYVIRKITSSGIVTTLAGNQAQLPGYADGTGAAALFAGPYGVAVDVNGHLYVTSNEVLRIGLDVSNAWLVNLSSRAFVQGGENLLIAGFVTTGSAAKSILVRGDGPALGTFGVTNFLSDPQLTLISGSTTVATANSWSASLNATFAKVGAFALAAGSHDAAVLETVAPGAYTAQVVSQTTNSGVALAEIYDADSGAPTNRLINISARALVGTQSNILIGGFVLSGSTNETLLIRADGPGLSAFGVTGVVANPILTLFNSSGAIIASNTGWGNQSSIGSGAVLSGPGEMLVQPATSAISAEVGAFQLAAISADSAMVVTLPPGSYTAQVSGAGSTTGVGLVEIYEVK